MQLRENLEFQRKSDNFKNKVNNIHIETLGCRLNQIESEAAAQYFLQSDFTVTMSPTNALQEENEDTALCILNTCTVTQKAEQKARRIIRLILKKYPRALLIVTGCYAQMSPKEIAEIDERIFVLPGQLKSRITAVPELLNAELKKDKWKISEFKDLLEKEIKSKKQDKSDVPENSFKLSATSFIAHSRASLKIQDGCNSNCSYCAIHMARGKSVSVDFNTALKRVQELENKGYDEVVLTTVNISQYKGEFNGKYFNFAKLLKYLLQNTEKINFRISSLYPQIVDDDFCNVIADKRVRPFFHISVQSGSNKILQLMNRKYEADAVLQACEKIRKVKENPFIACDIITGFPGETDEDFAQTMDLCKKCGFVWIHAFPFSERPGTAAVTLKNKVPQSISGKRAASLTEWAIKQKINYIEENKGKKLSAIIESIRNPTVRALNGKTNNYHGMTENFIHCEIITDNKVEINKEVQIEITEVLEDRIIKGGEIEARAKIIL